MFRQNQRTCRFRPRWPGKKKMLLIIVGIYTIGISVAAISTNFSILIIARIMQGVGASMFAISFSIIREKFNPEKLAVAQGIFSSMFSAGAVIGVAIGGTIINNFGWHAIFLGYTNSGCIVCSNY